MKNGLITLCIGMFLLFSPLELLSQETQSKTAGTSGPSEPSLPEETFSADQNLVWENLLQLMKEQELPIATSDKTTGTLATATKRYFKILSAKFPPVQMDYRDTYKINLEPAGSSTKVKIERKFEVYDHNARNWVEGDPVKEKAGVGVNSLFEELRGRLETSQASQE